MDAIAPEPIDSGGSSSSSSLSPSLPPPPLSPGGNAKAPAEKADEGNYYKLDAVGRRYLYDKYDNRVYKNPRKDRADALRPRMVALEDWAKLDQEARVTLSEHHKKLDATPAAAATRKPTKHVRRPLRRSNAAQIATTLCSLVAMMGYGMGEQIVNDNWQYDSTDRDESSDDDGVSDDGTHTLYSAEDPRDSDSCQNDSGDEHPDATNLDQEVENPPGKTRENNNEYPAMPCTQAHYKHREKNLHPHAHVNACVARSVKPAEVKTNLRAQVAMQLEWDRLRAVPRADGKTGVWDEGLVREWDHVSQEAQDRDEKANVGLIFGIVVEKNHELPETDPARKYKGRAVFQGNNVRDEEGNWAIFQELGSSPDIMEAARCADAYGMCPGNDIEQCDAEQAYTQALLQGTTTWVRLPRDQWPRHWRGMHDPVCPLILALYGHPDSGGHWEQHCTTLLASIGFKERRPWRSCFWHEELKLFLVVYVDDFKLSGPTENLKKGWDMIRKLVKTDAPSALGLFLGCRHDVFTRTLPNSDVVVRGIEYNMEDFLRSSVERYKELTGVTVLRRACTRRSSRNLRSRVLKTPTPTEHRKTTWRSYLRKPPTAKTKNRICRHSLTNTQQNFS